MDLRTEFRNLVTNKYMPGYNYRYTKYSFRTVNYVSHYKNIYCMCACAYEHEILDYISHTGEIDEVTYERVVDNIVQGTCPHVVNVRDKFVRETCTYAKHIAMAVGTLDALNKRGPHHISGDVFRVNPIEIALLKNNERSISEALEKLDGDEPGILSSITFQGIRKATNRNDVIQSFII